MITHSLSCHAACLTLSGGFCLLPFHNKDADENIITYTNCSQDLCTNFTAP